MTRKFVFVCILSLLSPLFLIKVSFAISGACSYHNGVNCSAGPNSQGNAVCNDGWASFVPYSQTDECQTSCLTPAEVTDRINVAEQEKNQYIQLIQNEYASILSNDSASLNQPNEECLRMGVCSMDNQANTQYAVDQSKEQLAISQIQWNTSLQEGQIKAEGFDCPAPVTPTCPVGASLSGTTCVCGTGRVLWSNMCLSQAMYNSINCSQTYGSNYDYSTSTNSCVIKEPQCQTGYALINGACWQIVTSTPATVPSVNNSGIANTSATPTINVTPSAPLITKNLSIGSSGGDVLALQAFLENKGYLTLPAGATNGYFGNLTKQALVAFQQSAGLPATGYCGSLTRQIINGK